MDQQTAEKLERLLAYRLLLRPQEVSEVCAVSLPVVYQWFHQDGFPVIREGRALRVTVDGLRQWLADRAANGG